MLLRNIGFGKNKIVCDESSTLGALYAYLPTSAFAIRSLAFVFSAMKKCQGWMLIDDGVKRRISNNRVNCS